ncbi:MAG: Gfo/Idh/MocA family protein [Chloroflexota bacterium]|nr:MAG: hypothetical protein DLM70_06630 [Chloroflexota bacterium]
MSRIRIGIIGAKHPHIFPRLDLARIYAERCAVVGVYDSDRRTLDRIHETYGTPVFDDLEAALENVDLAFVEGYDYQNPELVRVTIPHVKALMLEKPGAPNLAALRDLVDFCATFPVYVSIGYMLEWSPIMAHLHEIIDSGVLGPVTLARFHCAAPVGGAAEIWQSLPQDEGGLLWTDGCHLMRTVVDLLGQPQTAIGFVRKLPPGETIVADIFKRDILSGLGGEAELQIGTLVHEDVAAGILNYEDKLVTFDITGWEAHGWVEMWRIELWGANATLEAGLMPPWYRLHVRRDHPQYGRGIHERRMAGPGSAETSLVPDEAYTREFLHMLDVMEAGDTDQSELHAGLQTMEILDAMFRSSRQGGPVSVGRGR